MKRWLAYVAVLAATVGACSYRPARFANRAPVTQVHDDRPIAVPAQRAFIEDLYQADVYVRRELTNGLDPRRIPEALDVSSMDDVPHSSWFRGSLKTATMFDDYAKDGPPRPPFQLLDEEAASETPGAIALRDARGLRYELLHDPEGREGMRTTGAAVASRLVHALGYRTAEVHVITSHEGRRAVATRWPPGIDLGPTPIASTRPDDPNDFLPHVDRRTLRTLFHVTAWLDLRRLTPRILGDVYVGKRGKGHVQHQLVGLDGALGADNFDDAVAWAEDPDREGSNFFLKMFSLGLSPKPPGFYPTPDVDGVGLIAPVLLPERWDMSPPFEPTDRILPGDAYWFAKRLAAVPPSMVRKVVREARVESAANKWLVERLLQRRRALIAHGYAQTTPCDVAAIVDEPRALTLVDYAVFGGYVPTSQRSYRVRVLDDEGDPVLPERGVAATGAIVRVPLVASLDELDYFVVQVHAAVGDQLVPRPVEVHINNDASKLRVVGVRH